MEVSKIKENVKLPKMGFFTVSILAVIVIIILLILLTFIFLISPVLLIGFIFKIFFDFINELHKRNKNYHLKTINKY
tara:strand:+ start:4938 stop:5168 length:231 start_codon:yes stop_codon:yes gene_type:complete